MEDQHPHVADPSLPLILAHRGLSRHRIACLMADLAHPGSHACHEIDRLLPTARRTQIHWRSNGWHVRFDAVLAPDTLWDGERLDLGRAMPEVLLASMVGRPLNSIIGHPSLPSRPIRRATVDNGRTVLTVDPQLECIDEMAPSLLAEITGPLRRWMRRRALSVRSDTHAGHGEAMEPTLLVLLALALLVAPFFATGDLGDPGALGIALAAAVVAVLSHAWLWSTHVGHNASLEMWQEDVRRRAVDALRADSEG